MSTVWNLSDPRQLMGALGPDIIMMVGAMMLMLYAAWAPDSDRHQRRVGIGSLVLTVITLVAVIVYWERGWTSTNNGVIAVDNFRWAADVIILLGTLLTIALSIDYNSREGLHAGETHVLVLFATSGMMLLVAARDLMILFLGIELMSISSYVLAGMNRRSPRSAEGALKYFLLGAFSTGFLLYGIALVYGGTGSVNLQVIGQRIVDLGLYSSPILLVGIALLLIGFGFKVAAAPFHMWAPDVYEGAPTPITGYMATAVKAAAFAAFLRVWVEAFPNMGGLSPDPVAGGAETVGWYRPAWNLAVLTMWVGNLIALTQRNIKRMLAYSSIAHAGYALVAIVVASRAAMTGTPDAAAATNPGSAFLFYLLAYTLATMGAFAVVIALGNSGERSLDIDDYAGLWYVRPGLAIAMSVFMLALLGFPIFGGMGFFGKWYLLQAALTRPHRQVWLAVTVVVTSVVSCGYYLRVVMVMFMQPRRAGATAPLPVGRATGLVIAATAAAILIFGIYPTPVVRRTRDSALLRPNIVQSPVAPQVGAPPVPPAVRGAALTAAAAAAAAR